MLETPLRADTGNLSLSLALNLAGADAKLDRVRLHLEGIKRELPVELNKEKPYSFRVTPADSNGWASLIAETKG